MQEQLYIFGFMVLLFVIGYMNSKAKTKELEKIPSDAVFIDVRSPGEFKSGSIKGAVNIPVGDVAKDRQKISDLIKGNHNRAIVVYCASGIRSKMAKKTLLNAGFTNVINGGAYSHLVNRV